MLGIEQQAGEASIQCETKLSHRLSLTHAPVIYTKEHYLDIEYKLNKNITSSKFIEVLKNSTLGKRRPIDDLEIIKGMIENADIIVTATIDNKIIGIARAITDFNYCCYLSDLAVDEQYQKNGIGKKLISKVQEQLNDKCKVILLSAPDATEYYPKIGFTQHNSAWTIIKDQLT